MTPSQVKQTGFLRLKIEAQADSGVFEGYGSVFGNVDSYGDIVLPGAFRETLAEHKAAGTLPAMLWMHDSHAPIGRWLEMAEDSVGLHVKGKLNLNTIAGREANSHISAGDVGGLSIGYMIPQGGAVFKDGIQQIRAAKLLEVSVVTLPANQQARIQLGSKGDLEALLTKSGLAKEAARRIAFGGWPALTQDHGGDEVAELVRAVKASAQRFERL